MNRKKLIIFSATGLILVLIALIGITYGFYVTRIAGNTNRSSIFVSSTTLALEYSEDEDSNIMLDNIEPGVMSSKTFTIKNIGETVVDSYGVYLEEITNTFSRTEDLVITLTCKEYDENGSFVRNCNGIDENIVNPYEFPTQNTLLVTNVIESGYIHEYVFSFEYLFLEEVDQTVDVGESLSGLIQIYFEPDVINIYGLVTGYSSGDYIEVQNDDKISKISENDIYRITALGLGHHTIYLKDSEGNTKASKSIKINKTLSGEESITEDGTKIIMVNNSENFVVNINYDGNDLSFVGELAKDMYLTDKILADNTAQSDENINFYYDSEGNCVNTYYDDEGNASDYDDICTNSSIGLYYTSDTSYTENNKVSYYFRGDVQNNYVQFGAYENDFTVYIGYYSKTNTFNYKIYESLDACESATSYNYNCTEKTIWNTGDPIYWRIVRINEDGSIRLLYVGPSVDSNGIDAIITLSNAFNTDVNSPAYVGYMYGNYRGTTYALTHANTNSSNAKTQLESWYATHLLNYASYVSDSGFCNDRSIYSGTGIGNSYTSNTTFNIRTYDSSYILRFSCPQTNDLFTTSTSDKGNKTLTNPIGLLTISEMIYAGYAKNTTGYIKYATTFIDNENYNYTMTPYDYTTTYSSGTRTYKPRVIYYYNTHTSIHSSGVIVSDNNYKLRPVINLKGSVKVTDRIQLGTKTNPYIIATD